VNPSLSSPVHVPLPHCFSLVQICGFLHEAASAEGAALVGGGAGAAEAWLLGGWRSWSRRRHGCSPRRRPRRTVVGCCMSSTPSMPMVEEYVGEQAASCPN
jgi:hypothetical protein